MDPRIAWCTPEQLGPAYRHWLRLWELSTASKHGGPIMRNDTNKHSSKEDKNKEKQHDFIPLHCNSFIDSKQGAPHGRREYVVGDGSNKASTYGLNHSSNLDILEKRKHTPWRKFDKRYPSNSIMW